MLSYNTSHIKQPSIKILINMRKYGRYGGIPGYLEKIPKMNFIEQLSQIYLT